MGLRLSKSPQLKDRKQHILLWFRFLQLSHQIPEFKKNLKESKTFYRPWGDVKGVKFDHWWKDHRDLFGSSRVEEIDRVKRSSTTINVQIPLNQPVSKSMKEVRELVLTRQEERIKELGLSTYGMKSKKVSVGLYEVTNGVEIRSKTLYEILLMMEIWVDLGRPKVSTEYVDEVITRMRNRPRSKWIPYLLNVSKEPTRKGDKMVYPENTLRQVRRYITRGMKVCENVSKGEFPGRQTLK